MCGVCEAAKAENICLLYAVAYRHVRPRIDNFCSMLSCIGGMTPIVIRNNNGRQSLPSRVGPDGVSREQRWADV